MKSIIGFTRIFSLTFMTAGIGMLGGMVYNIWRYFEGEPVMGGSSYAVVALTLGMMGIIFFLAGFFIFRTTIRRGINRNWECIKAKVVDVSGSNTYVNGVQLLTVVCEYHDPYSGRKIRFISDKCFDDPGDIYSPDEEIPVYIKDHTYKRYKVDLYKFYEAGMR